MLRNTVKTVESKDRQCTTVIKSAPSSVGKVQIYLGQVVTSVTVLTRYRVGARERVTPSATLDVDPGAILKRQYIL